MADALGTGLHFADGVADALVGLHRLAGRCLDGGDLAGNFVRGAGSLVGQALHFLRHHGKAATGVTGTGGLDRGVERQQVGLAGNVADQAQDRFDRLGMVRQGGRHGNGVARLRRGALCHFGGAFHFGARVLDRADQAGRGAGGLAHRKGGLFGGGGDFRRLAQHAAGRGGGILGLFAQRFAQLRRAVDLAHDALFEQDAELLARIALAFGIVDRDHIGHQPGIDHADLRHDVDQPAPGGVVGCAFPDDIGQFLVGRGDGQQHAAHRNAVLAGVADAGGGGQRPVAGAVMAQLLADIFMRGGLDLRQRRWLQSVSQARTVHIGGEEGAGGNHRIVGNQLLDFGHATGQITAGVHFGQHLGDGVPGRGGGSHGLQNPK